MARNTATIAAISPVDSLVTICAPCAPLAQGSYAPVYEQGAWVDVADQPYTIALTRFSRAEQVTGIVARLEDDVFHTCYICRGRKSGGAVGACKQG